MSYIIDCTQTTGVELFPVPTFLARAIVSALLVLRCYRFDYVSTKSVG